MAENKKNRSISSMEERAQCSLSSVWLSRQFLGASQISKNPKCRYRWGILGQKSTAMLKMMAKDAGFTSSRSWDGWTGEASRRLLFSFFQLSMYRVQLMSTLAVRGISFFREAP